MPSPLSVVSERGLKEIRLYNGQHLFRRFLPRGAKEFHQTLVLDGTVQKNIVLVAEDTAGGKAVTFARRCWKDGSLAVSFCSDHVNDGTMALAHGPYSYQVIRHPSLPADVAGDTWDGGPLASLPLTGHQNTMPVLECDQGREDGSWFDQVPLLEFTDEGAMAVRGERRELFDPRVLTVVNPWHTYGPIQGPAPLVYYTQKYCEYLPPTVGVPQTGWAGPEGSELFIQVTKVARKPDCWHVSVNNPTDRVITTTLRAEMKLPGLELPAQSLSLQPGEYRVIM